MFELSGMGLIYAVQREQEAGSEERQKVVLQRENQRRINKESEDFFKK